MEKNETTENDCEIDEGEMKSVVFTAITLLGGVLAISVSLILIFVF